MILMEMEYGKLEKIDYLGGVSMLMDLLMIML